MDSLSVHNLTRGFPLRQRGNLVGDDLQFLNNLRKRRPHSMIRRPATGYQRSQSRWQAAVHGWSIAAFHHFLFHFSSAKSLKGQLVRCELPEDHSKAVDVYFLIVRLPQIHLRSHVAKAACPAGHLIGLLLVRPLDNRCHQPEIKYLESAIRRETDIIWL